MCSIAECNGFTHADRGYIPRLLKLTFNWWPDGRKIHFLVGYAPPATYDEDEREIFSGQLEIAVALVPKRDFL